MDIKAMTVKLIESQQNPNFKRWRSLHDSRGVKKQQQFLLSGRRLALEMLQTHADWFQEAVIMDEEFLIELQAFPHLNIYQLPSPLFKELDLLGTKGPLLIGQVPELLDADLTRSPVELEVLLATGEPGNLGGALRVCEAFSAKKVILLRESANPFHPKALKAASGSTFRLPLFKGPSIEEVQNFKECMALDLDGVPLGAFRWPQNSRLLIGEEGPGVPLNFTGIKLNIPVNHNLESLNALSALSIALWDYRRQQK